jgi:hypothetical protein
MRACLSNDRGTKPESERAAAIGKQEYAVQLNTPVEDIQLLAKRDHHRGGEHGMVQHGTGGDSAVRRPPSFVCWVAGATRQVVEIT